MRLSPLGSSGVPTQSALLFLPGAALVGIGLAIILLPQLLTYLVAGLFLVIGGMLLLAAWQMKRGPFSRRMVGFLDRLRGPNTR